MRDRRSTVGRLTGIVEGVATAARRRQQGRAPRVTLYDEAGHPRRLPSDAAGFEELLAAAQAMSELVQESVDRPVPAGAGEEGESSSGGVSVPESPRGERNDRAGQRRKP